MTRFLLAAMLLTGSFHSKGADARFTIEARINDQPVHLILDTGAEVSVLFRKAAARLGLKITKIDQKEPMPAGKVHADRAEECKLTTGETSQKFTFGVIDSPSYMLLDMDGVIGWGDVSNRVVVLDFEQGQFGLYDFLPVDVQRWARWRIVSSPGVLLIACTNDLEAVKIGIDTGSPDGVVLSPRRWEKYRQVRAKWPATLTADFLPADGLIVREVVHARKCPVGPLAFDDVPVIVTSRSVEVAFEQADAVLGLFALKRMKLVIDGRNGVVYTAPISRLFANYDYNRLGAVFVPKDPNTSVDLKAHVMAESPAFRAGLRDGDVLLKIDDLDATQWRTDPRILPMSRFWSQAAGTKILLSWKRVDGDKSYEASVTLEEPLAE